MSSTQQYIKERITPTHTNNLKAICSQLVTGLWNKLDAADGQADVVIDKDKRNKWSTGWYNVQSNLIAIVDGEIITRIW